MKIDKKLLIDCVKHSIFWEENMNRAFKLKKVKGLFNDCIYYKRVQTNHYIKLNKLLSNLEQKEIK